MKYNLSNTCNQLFNCLLTFMCSNDTYISGTKYNQEYKQNHFFVSPEKQRKNIKRKTLIRPIPEGE